MNGRLAIETTLPAQSPRQFSKRRVQFTALVFGTKPQTNIAYEQFQVTVVVDSQHRTTRFSGVKPKRTPDSDREEKWLDLRTALQGGMTGTTMKTNEKTAGSAKKRYNSAITENRGEGIVQWGFDVDDVNLKKRGIDMRKDDLPAVQFEFVGNHDEVPPPPPEGMDIVVTSYWAMDLRVPGPGEPKSNWMRRLLRLSRSSGNAQTTSYSNLFQIAAFKTVPAKLPVSSDYMADVEVRAGVSGDPVLRLTALDSVGGTSVVVDDPQKLNTFNCLPTIAKFKFSDNCIHSTWDNLDRDSKSH